jgi:hypothetical protein
MRQMFLRDSPLGLRHYLGGRLVNGSDTIEICFSGGWVVGRYERTDDPERPLFHCSIELANGGVAKCVIEIPDGAIVRWPRS